MTRGLRERLLKRLVGLLRLVERRVSLLGGGVGAVALQALLQRLEILRELLGALLKFLEDVLVVLRATAVSLCALRLGELACLVLQRLHRPFERRALQDFGALLQRVAHFLLLLCQFGQRLLRLLARQLLRRVLQLLQGCQHFRCQRLTHQVLRLLELTRERRVERAGLTQLVFEPLGSLLHGLHALLHFLLLLREALCLLRLVEVHRLRFAGLRIALAGRLGRLLLQLLHRLGQRRDACGGGIGRGARGAALFVSRGNFQRQFTTDAFGAPG